MFTEIRYRQDVSSSNVITRFHAVAVTIQARYFMDIDKLIFFDCLQVLDAFSRLGIRVQRLIAHQSYLFIHFYGFFNEHIFLVMLP